MANVRIISIANHKGGVGKTTTTASLGSILASRGKKVLVIDLDAQANLTTSLFKGEIELSIYDAMKGDVSLPVINIEENLDLVPSSLQLAMADIEFASYISRESILKEKISPIKDGYDYILIDCPPSLSLLTLNSFTASTDIIIPLKAEVLPFKGLSMISEFTKTVQKKLNPQVHITGILITQWKRTNLTSMIEAGLRSSNQYIVYDTKIRENITIAEAPLESRNIVSYAPKSNGARDYVAFTDEFLQKMERE